MHAPGSQLTKTIATSQPLYILDSSRGLASNQVHGLARDHLRRIWMASPVGLARFDGSFIEQRDRNNGLQCNGLRCVAIDPTGNIWIGTDLGIEILDGTGRPIQAMEPGAWSFGLCQRMDVSRNSPWLGTAHGLVRLEPHRDGNDFQVAFKAETGFVGDVVALDDQRIFAATSLAGLVETDGRTWWGYRCEGLIGRQVVCVGLGSAGELLVGTDDGLYVIDDSDRTVTTRLKPPQGDSAVTAIGVGADRYWAAFGRTLMGYANDKPGLPAIEHFSIDSAVNALMVDELGNVFVATNSTGVALVSCLRHALARIDLGRDGGVYSIKPAGADGYTVGGEQIFGKIIVPPERGDSRIVVPDDAESAGNWNALARMPISRQGWRGLPDTIVWDTLEDEAGIWAATQNGLFHSSASGAFAQQFADDPVLGAPNRVLMQRGQEIWAGTLRGLACIRNGVAASITSDGASLGYVYAMHLDDQAMLWIGTLGRGLWQEKQGLKAVVGGPLTADGNTYAIAQGANGRIVVLQDEKVVLLDHDLTPRLITTLPPVAGWTALWIDAQRVAIGASDGLRIVDVGTGNVISHIQSLFRSRDWEFTNNRTLVCDRHGHLLCGLNGGLVRVNLEKLGTFAPPECRLANIIWHGIEPAVDGGIVRLRPGRWSFQLRAFAAWFVESSKVRYQFKLVGFDDTWSRMLETAEISFNSLPPGQYRLLCRAYSPLAGMGPEAELLQLEVRRPYWAMGWATALTAIESLYDRQIRSRARNERLLSQNRSLEQAVAERTRALVIANQELESVRDAYKQLSEVDELTRLGNRRSFEKELSRALTLTTRLQLPLSLLMVDIDHFKLVNDRHGHQVGDDYLRAVGQVLAATIRVGEDVATRYGGEEFAVVLVNTDTAGGIQTAERIRAAVDALALLNSGAPGGKVTLSIGVATVTPGEVVTKESLIGGADRALYQAKNSGRNRVSAAH